MMPQGDYMMAPQHPGYYPGYQMNHMGQMPPQPPMPTAAGQGFMLHGQPQSLPHHNMYQNGQGYYSPEHQYRGYPSTAQSYGSSKLILVCKATISYHIITLYITVFLKDIYCSKYL